MKSQEYVKFGCYEFKKTINLLLKKNEYIGYNNLKLLYQCYVKPSIYKQRAYNDCLALVDEINKTGDCLVIRHGISGYNCMMFTYIIYCIIDNRECIITRTKSSDKITYIKRID